MIEADVIDREIQRVGAQMNRELAGERPLFLGVLNGAFMFVSDLLKHITIDGALLMPGYPRRGKCRT